MAKIKNWSRDKGKPTDLDGYRRGKDGYLLSNESMAWSHDKAPRYRAYITPKQWGSRGPEKWAFIVTGDGNTIIRKKAKTKEEARKMATKWMRNHPQGPN